MCRMQMSQKTKKNKNKKAIFFVAQRNHCGMHVPRYTAGMNYNGAKWARQK